MAGEKLLSSAHNVFQICPFEDRVKGSLYITNLKLVFERSHLEVSGSLSSDVSFLLSPFSLLFLLLSLLLLLLLLLLSPISLTHMLTPPIASL